MALEAAPLVLAAGGFLGGLLVGLAMSQGARKARARVRQLESDLRRAAEDHAAYRDQVAKHFEGTSDLFRELTRQYTEVYAHLAEGARELCRDRVPEIGRGFSGPALAAPAEPGAQAGAELPRVEGERVE